MTQRVGRNMTSVEWALLIALSLLWGGSFFFNSVALNELPPFTVVALRVVLAAVMLNLFVWARGLRLQATPGSGLPLSPWGS